jgi:hypothetical protein
MIGQWLVNALPRPINRRCANQLCAYEIGLRCLLKFIVVNLGTSHEQ